MYLQSKTCLVVFLAFVLIQSSLGELICEELPSDLCALAISSSGKRCVLEKYKDGTGETKYECGTSEVVVGRMSEYIETDECVEACGIDRQMVGISSDNLLQPHFRYKLCSPSCYNKCPNIVDLYFKLAQGEGVYLPDLCQKIKGKTRRSMVELMSSGAAPAPISSSLHADEALPPAPSPAFNF